MGYSKKPKIGMSPKKRRSAFTLVELVVVITILAILGTIGFLSVGGYSSRARDADRLADVANISKSLDLSAATVGNYPVPDNSFSVTYSGAAVWYQGIVGTSVLQSFRSSIAGGGLSKKPVDPLDGSDYVYSSLAFGKAYQIGADYEGDLSPTAMSVLPLAYAAPWAPTITYVRGNYGGLVAKTVTWSTTYVLAVPSILSNTGSVGSVLKIELNSLSGTLLFNGKNTKGASSYNPVSVVFSGANLPKDDSSGQLTAMVNSLKAAYTGSDIVSNSAISSLMSTATGSLGTMGTNILVYQLGGTSGGGSNGLVSGQCSGLPANAAYYGSAASYSLSSAPAGTSLSASGVTTPAANTCQFSCTGWYSLDPNTNSCTSAFLANGAGSSTMRQRLVSYEADGWALCGDSAAGNLTSWQSSANCSSKTGKVMFLMVPQNFAAGIAIVYNRSDYKQCSSGWGTYYYGDDPNDDITGTADGYSCSTGSYGLFAGSISTDGCGFGPCGSFNASGSWTESSGWTGNFTRRWGGSTLAGYDYASWGCNNSTWLNCSNSYTIVRTQIWRK